MANKAQGFTTELLEACNDAARENGFVHGVSYAADLAAQHGLHQFAALLTALLKDEQLIKSNSGKPPAEIAATIREAVH